MTQMATLIISAGERFVLFVLALKLRKDVGLEWHSNLERHVLGSIPWISRKIIKPINYLYFAEGWNLFSVTYIRDKS